MNCIGAILASTFIACAQPPAYDAYDHELDPPAPGNGRIFLYRKLASSATLRPEIQIDGESVGRLPAGAFIFIDLPPGNYRISTTVTYAEPITLTLEEQSANYVRLHLEHGGSGYKAQIVNMKAEIGLAELMKTRYAGDMELLDWHVRSIINVSENRKAIRSRTQEWIAASLAGDVDAYIGFLTEDFVWLGDRRGSSIHGPASMRDFLLSDEQAPELSIENFRSIELLFSTRGTEAMHEWTGVAIVDDPQSGEKTKEDVVLYDYWRKEGAGPWLCARRIFIVVDEPPRTNYIF